MASSFEKFYVKGGKKLLGSVKTPGSKNAALPILAATLAVDGVSTVHNVPSISDVHLFLEMLQSVGAKIEKNGSTVTVDARNLTGNGEISHFGVKKMRASILLLAPLLVRFGEAKMEFPGGCVLGKRSADTHLRAFEALGAKVLESKNFLHLSLEGKKFVGNTLVLPEISVTATENALVAAAFAEGKTMIRLAAAEPHVQNLCSFLCSAGAKIEGIGSHFLEISGRETKKNPEISVVSDYLQAGTLILAAVLTDSHITVEEVEISHLDSFLERLAQTNANFVADEAKKTVEIFPRTKPLVATDIQTGVHPKFPTDLHPQFAVLLTQCEGTSKIFETLFERKFAYLLELEKMRADIEIQNPHVFLISGSKKLYGAAVASQDIRAGAAMLLAALCADGETEISNIHYIDRGYEQIEETLNALGADIVRKKQLAPEH